MLYILVQKFVWKKPEPIFFWDLRIRVNAYSIFCNTEKHSQGHCSLTPRVHYMNVILKDGFHNFGGNAVTCLAFLFLLDEGVNWFVCWNAGGQIPKHLQNEPSFNMRGWYH